jgi:predicted amidohydrolase YtcJ
VRVAALFTLAVAAFGQAPADLILDRGKVWTADRARPFAEAVAIRGAEITAIGASREIDALRGPATRVIDLHGRPVLPGFNDAHTHFENAVQWFFEVRLIDVSDQSELLRRLHAAARRVPAGIWITATDWGALAGWKKDAPAPPVLDVAAVDAITPDHPVLLRRYDRAFFANSQAFRTARIRENTPDPKGGHYGRDASGKLSGMLFGTAGEQMELLLPPRTATQKRIGARAVIADLNRLGITSIHDIARLDEISQQHTFPTAVERSYSDAGIFVDLLKRGELSLRVYALLPLQTWSDLAAHGIRPGTGGDFLHFGALKDFTDGSFMLAPYANNPANSGGWTFRFPGEDVMARNIAAADRAGFDIGIHVTGDRALHELLDWYEAAIRQNGPRDRRFRLIHAWFATAADLERAGKMHLIADITPDQLLNDPDDAAKIAGPERARTAFAWRTMIRNGVKLDIVSDLPGLFNKQQVATVNPLENIYLAITRAWHPEQRLSLEEALEACTANPAYASHEENRKGSVSVGKLADLVVLSRDIFTGTPQDLLRTSVDYTILGGRVVYQGR